MIALCMISSVASLKLATRESTDLAKNEDGAKDLQSPTCHCRTPNAGVSQFNGYTCDDGSEGYCMAAEPCHNDQVFAKEAVGDACGFSNSALDEYHQDKIPWKLWQTLPTSIEDIGAPLREHVLGWETARMDHKIENDTEIEELVKEVSAMLEKDTVKQMTLYQAFMSMPLPVMKADIWRYAALYKEGGFYADIDVSWDKNTHPKTGPGVAEYLKPYSNKCSMLIGLENDCHFCQWFIGGSAGHPLLRTALKLITARAVGGVDVSNPNFVHFHTGPGLWTDAIEMFMVEGAVMTDVPSPPGGCTRAKRYLAPLQAGKLSGICAVGPDLCNKHITNAAISGQADSVRGNIPSWAAGRDALRSGLKKADG